MPGSYLRLGKVVDVASGSIQLEWIDGVGGTDNLRPHMLTGQVYSIPKVGDIAIVAFGAWTLPHIIGYTRIDPSLLPLDHHEGDLEPGQVLMKDDFEVTGPPGAPSGATSSWHPAPYVGDAGGGYGQSYLAARRDHGHVPEGNHVHIFNEISA